MREDLLKEFVTNCFNLRRMNLELLENFGQNYPEDYDGALDCFSMALTSQFNRQGTLLAVGCNDGRLVIWDFLTRGYHCAVESGRFAWI